MRISASLLSCDLLNLESEIKILEEAGIDAIHIDIMDGHFVPNIAFGIDMVKQVGKITNLPLTVHLMMNNPEQFIDVISYANVDYLIIHSEGIRNVTNLFERIKSKGIGVGLAINPRTSVNETSMYLQLTDLALIMGVHPGFGGQKLIPSTLEKIRQIRAVKNNIIIGIDGGINESTVSFVNKQKPDILVVGSCLFDNPLIENSLSGSNNRDAKLNSIKGKIKILCREE